MKLEDQVCSLELAKHLKKLGVKQNAFWHWAPDHEGNFMDLFSSGQTEFDISAFSVAELGEMLPEPFYSWKMRAQFWCGDPSDLIHTNCQGATTEADARAKMLLSLIENKLVKV